MALLKQLHYRVENHTLLFCFDYDAGPLKASWAPGPLNLGFLSGSEVLRNAFLQKSCHYKNVSFNRGEELQKLDVRRQHINMWVIFLSIFGVVLAVTENELLWHNRNIPVMSFQLIKLLNSGVTVFLFYMILQ